MSGMIERVARAIGHAADENTPFDQCGDGFKEICREYARAAIEAMREPTNAMYVSASDAFVPASDAAACWHAMIDAALKD